MTPNSATTAAEVPTASRSFPGRKTPCPHTNGGSASDARANPGRSGCIFPPKRKGPRARARGRVRPRRRRDDAGNRRRAERQPAAPAAASCQASRPAQPARTASISSPFDIPPPVRPVEQIAEHRNCAAGPSEPAGNQVERFLLEPADRRASARDHGDEQQVTDGTITTDVSWLC